MYNVVTVLGMVSHAIHSTKGRALAVISTYTQVITKFSLKQSPFLVMYLTLTYYISLDGVIEDYDFLESHAVMLQATGQDSTTCVTRRLNHLVFILFIQMIITLFLKLLTQVIFQFHWMPCRGYKLFLPKHLYKDFKIWTRYVTLICFPMVVWQQIDRIMVQS